MYKVWESEVVSTIPIIALWMAKTHISQCPVQIWGENIELKKISSMLQVCLNKGVAGMFWNSIYAGQKL